MKNFKKYAISIFIYFIIFSFAVCIHIAAQESKPAQNKLSIGNIYLYGEHHADEIILKKEIKLWGDYYNNKGFRHLFVEMAYFSAEFLNIWMHSESDTILDKIYDDWKGTLNHSPAVKEFFKEIKTRFPETIFHGTDIGHQYQTTGKRYLEYLSKHNMENTIQYQYAKEVIEQGKFYYGQKKDGIFRENKMVANFVREFDNIKNISVMGIYGSAHTGINSMDRSNSVPSMANQLDKLYTNRVFTEYMVDLVKDIDPLRIDSIKINGSYYKALYFGRNKLKGFKDYEYRDFWQLEQAYNDFKKAPKTGDVLPYDNYPMKIELGQVFVIEYKKIDSTLIRKIFRSDGMIWNKKLSTEEIKAK